MMNHHLKSVTLRMLDTVRPLLNFFMSPPVRRFASIVMFLLTMGFLLSILAGGWVKIYPHLVEMRWQDSLAGLAFTFVSFGLGGFVWYAILRGLGIQSRIGDSVSIHMSSSATKYLPGFGWQYMSKAYLSRHLGARRRLLAAALAVEAILILGIGVVLAVAVKYLFGRNWEFAWTPPQWLWGIAGLAALIVVVGMTVYLPSMAGTSDASSASASGAVRATPGARRIWLLIALALAGIAWVMSAASAYSFALALNITMTFADFWQIFFAVAFGSVVSILVVIVPVGIGVRETVVALLLTGVMPIGLAVVIALLMRLSAMICELLAFVAIARRWPFSQRESGGILRMGYPEKYPENRIDS